MAGLLEGKRILVTGIITDASIAFHIAKVAQEQGAEVVLTGFDRMRLIERIADRLPQPAPPPSSSTCRTRSTSTRWPTGSPRCSATATSSTACVHSIGFVPQTGMGDQPVPRRARARTSPRASTSRRTRTRRWPRRVLPVMNAGGSIVGMDFDPTRAMPAYNWMSVAKSALESVNRFVAREVGPTVSGRTWLRPGPIRTLAAKAIVGGAPGDGRAQMNLLEEGWDGARRSAGT